MTYYLGFLKQVISGETVVIREKASDGPPPSKTIVITNIVCPKLARRPLPNNPIATSDEPFAWQAREFIRSNYIGKEVCYIIEREISPEKAYGQVFIGHDPTAPNLANLLVEEGLASVRKIDNPQISKSPAYQKLCALKTAAESDQKLMWSGVNDNSIRDIVWNIEDSAAFVQQHTGKLLRGTVEYIRDGCTFQILLHPFPEDDQQRFHYITVALSGVKTPAIRYRDGFMDAEEFAQDALFFVESRLLQREVNVILEGVNNQMFVGSVIHPNGNIAMYLLQEGLARCLQWNLLIVSSAAGGSDAYKGAEREAQAKRLRIWHDYVPPVEIQRSEVPQQQAEPLCDTSYLGMVLEVGTAGNVVVKCKDGVIRKFFLSSYRPPRQAAPAPVESDAPHDRQPQKRDRFRPQFDIPYMFETCEFLRKRLVGKHVKVEVDYVQPPLPNVSMDEKVQATVHIGPVNIAEALLSKGFGTAIRYRNIKESRSRCYDALLAAEAEAQRKGLGIFSSGNPPVHRVADITRDVAKARQFLPSLKRGHVDAVVEFVSTASRLRIYIPAQTCQCTFLCSGIVCPKPSRNGSNDEPGDPFGDEALQMVRELAMQRDIKVEADTLDRIGGVIGWAFLPNPVSTTHHPLTATGTKAKKAVVSSTNLSVILVARGLASVHRSPATQRSAHYNELLKAEGGARDTNLGLWSSKQFREAWEAEMQSAMSTPSNDSADGGEDPSLAALQLSDARDAQAEAKAVASRVQSSKLAQITTISKAATGYNGIRFYVQYNANARAVESMNNTLNGGGAFGDASSFKPKRGVTCAARFSDDNLWYRCRITRLSDNTATVLYMDFGNDETISLDASGSSPCLRPLSDALKNQPPLATEYRLAYVELPLDLVDRDLALTAFSMCAGERDIQVFVVPGAPVACGKDDNRPITSAVVYLPAAAGSSQEAGTSGDVGEELLKQGIACTEKRKMPRDIAAIYSSAEETAKAARKNIWRYGDFRGDDAL